MDGITDEPMRQIQADVAKPDVMYTEFVSVEGFIRKPDKFQKQLTFKNNERPIIAQVFGAAPHDFEKAVAEISQMGFDAVDINMGCPSKTVVQRGAGGDLIGNYELSGKIINACLRGIESSGREIPLSVKTRIGQKNAEAKNWASFLVQFPLAEITIHGRLLSQGQKGEVNWEEVGIAARIIKEKQIIVLGNGGIKSIEEAYEKCQKYGLDGVLIGQAALGNPWIFKPFDYTQGKLRKGFPSEKILFQTLLKHAEKIQDFYGEKGYVMGLKHFLWYLKGLKNAHGLREKIIKTRNVKELKKVISLDK